MDKAAVTSPSLKNCAALLVTCLLMAAAEARSEVRAIVVGADRYAELPNLGGAAADASDLSDALRRAGATVTTLLDQDLTRQRLIEAWGQAVRDAEPGAIFLLAFAGHGIQIPDADGDETDGFDEAFVLPGFRPTIGDDANLISDDEIDQIVREVAPHLVILVADTCHSGTLTRAVDERADFRAARFVPTSLYRGLAYGPAAAATAAGAGAEPPDNSVLFAAVPEALMVQETLIEGRARGALSWAFARGVEGAADADADGTVTVRELTSYVPERIRAISHSRQTPVITARGEMEVGLFARLDAGVEEPPAVAATALAVPPVVVIPADAAQDERLRLALAGPQAADGSATAARLSGVEIVRDPLVADLIWHLPSGDVLTAQGDIAARLGPSRDIRILRGVVEKWRLLRALENNIDGTLGARIRPDDRLYRGGERFSLELASERDGRLLVFDLAADGSTILMLPRPGQAIPAIRSGAPYEVPLRAGPPFGADHLVAVRAQSAAAADRLVGLLRAVHGRPFDRGGVESFMKALGSAAVIPAGVYTGP